MNIIKFENPKSKTTYVINIEQVLWIEFLNGPDIKEITFYFSGDKKVSVTERQMGTDNFEALKISARIKDAPAAVVASDKPKQRSGSASK